MQTDRILYLPVAPEFFAILVIAFIVVTVAVQFRLLRYAYMQLGVSSKTAVLLLLGSLIGSYVNIPLVEIANRGPTVTKVVELFGMRYLLPAASSTSSTVIAVNVGGALIPAVMSFYLLAHYRLWRQGAICTAVVGVLCFYLATPVPGVGISVPLFVPAIASAVVAFVSDREYVAPLAYIGGSLGTLIGADLMNLDKVAGLGAQVASIGGAGTFDGIFLTSIIAVLLGSLTKRGAPEPA